VRTNIDIDDKLMKQAMKATGATTKRAAVEASLRQFLEVRANEKAHKRAIRLQQESRQTAIREGRLDEWNAEREKAEARFMEEFRHAHQP